MENGVEAEFSQHRFTIAVDDVSLGRTGRG